MDGTSTELVGVVVVLVHTMCNFEAMEWCECRIADAFNALIHMTPTIEYANSLPNRYNKVSINQSPYFRLLDIIGVRDDGILQASMAGFGVGCHVAVLARAQVADML